MDGGVWFGLSADLLNLRAKMDGYVLLLFCYYNLYLEVLTSSRVFACFCL